MLHTRIQWWSELTGGYARDMQQKTERLCKVIVDRLRRAEVRMLITEQQFDEWMDAGWFRQNPFARDSSWNGCMYKTYGAEHAYVLTVASHTPQRIATILEGDEGELCVSSGYHFVNRIGYLVATRDLPDFDVTIDLGEDE